MPSLETVVCGLRILFVLALGFGIFPVAGMAGVAQAKGTGLIFVSNEKGNTITVLDGKTNVVLRTIETCRRPRGMHFSKDLMLFYVECGLTIRL